ncbi:rab-GTPase-TBC domain-containing protein [Mycotypha africana]|uniref:rab-GTPase-TBC domain-containing protein n=1 Tax=Mycotypha africana TaxID=64632 RepID=UPI002300B75B|nr:rab-GTPase-TBC domain-containing protein [Mycotypha africana]KAI8970375.1 rab-GTPase-TBC domain-containing protein [Mycotypha africana]
MSRLRRGISPAHMRGSVWQALSNATSLHLERLYDQLKNEHTTFEYLIQRDVTRTFPNTKMFSQQRGQDALARVLRAYSLYDADVGYCQGLAFLVGPLLLNMPEEAAFCVFVRLMDTYGMRTLFTPDMDGLHLSLFQFDALLLELLPDLHQFLRSFGIQSQMYTSQWFLTLFAYIFPLPLIFRIYDIIFLEGPVETILRTSLTLLKKSADKLLKLTEFEEIMAYLSTKLIEPYDSNYDAIINDTAELHSIVTKTRLRNLESRYRQFRAKKESATKLIRSEKSAKANSVSSELPTAITATSVSPPTLVETLKKRDDQKSKSWFGTVKRARSVMLTRADTEKLKTMAHSRQEVTSISKLSSNSNNNNSSQRKPEMQVLHQQIEDLVKALSEVQKDNMLLKDKIQLLTTQQQHQATVTCEKVKSETSADKTKHCYGCGNMATHQESNFSNYCYCELEKLYVEAKIKINILETVLSDQQGRRSPTVSSPVTSPTLTRSSSIRSNRSTFSDLSSLPSPSSSITTLVEEFIPTATTEKHEAADGFAAIMPPKLHRTIDHPATARDQINPPSPTYQLHPSSQYTF